VVELTIVQGRNLESFVGSPDAGVSLTKQIIQEQGFDGKPLIIDDEAEFNRLAQKSGIMGYRGLGDGAEIPNYVKALREGDFYVECKGGRAHGRGAYFAITRKGFSHENSFITADEYATKQAIKDSPNDPKKYIFKITTSDDIRIIKESAIRKMRKNWVLEKLKPYKQKALSECGISEETFNKKIINIIIDKRSNGVTDEDLIVIKGKIPRLWTAFEKQGIDFRGIIESDIGTIAADKGFDAIVTHEGTLHDGVDYIVVLNRTKLIISEKEAQKP
jgi:hypothetical protein